MACFLPSKGLTRLRKTTTLMRKSGDDHEVEMMIMMITMVTRTKKMKEKSVHAHVIIAPCLVWNGQELEELYFRLGHRSQELACPGTSRLPHTTNNYYNSSIATTRTREAQVTRPEGTGLDRVVSMDPRGLGTSNRGPAARGGNDDGDDGIATRSSLRSA